MHPGVDVLLTVVNARHPEVQLCLFVLRRDLIATRHEEGADSLIARSRQEFQLLCAQKPFHYVIRCIRNLATVLLPVLASE